MIRIQHEATFFGANPFATMPVVVASITLSNNTAACTKILEQGCLRLHADFPEWFHTTPMSLQQPIAEMVAQTAVQWTLGALNEVRGFLHDAGARTTPEGARLWLGFHHPGVSFSALELALKVLADAGQSQTYYRNSVDASLASLWELCRRHHPDFQTRILMQAARVQNIPFLPFISGAKYWQYGWGSRSRIFFETMSNADGHIGYQLQHSKILGKALFSALGFPTPEYQLVDKESELARTTEVIGWPCVVKPLFSGCGKGVTAGIESISALKTAFAYARRYTNDTIMVEKFVPGDDHRLMVIDGKLTAVIRREPSAVTGDGKSAIIQLLELANRARSKNLLKSHYLYPIESDNILKQHLEQQGVALDTVLASGRRITLRSNANLSTGGVCFDVTAKTHPHIKKMAETIAKTMGLATVGLDFITTDIETSWQDEGALIEANATPGLGVLMAGGQDPLLIGSAMLGPIPARIPFQLIVTQRTNLTHAEIWLKSRTRTEGFGWTCNGKAAIEGMPLRITQYEPWAAVHALLRNKVVHHVCVVGAAEDIVRHGMPVDKVNQIDLCCDESSLPAEWLQVLIDHSDTVERFSSWEAFKSKELS
jgi:cyanophycin synthetase